jgi:hypothetical protein
LGYKGYLFSVAVIGSSVKTPITYSLSFPNTLPVNKAPNAK